MGLRKDFLNVVLNDLPNSDSQIDRSSPRFDELMGGKLSAGRWGRYEDPGDHRYGTTCAVTVVGWLLDAGAPPDLLNAVAPGGSGFTNGAHFSRLYSGAKAHGWFRSPVKGQLPDFRPGDIYFINHGNGNNAHTGVILSVTPSDDGQSLSVETADGGQNSAGPGDIRRQIRTFSLGSGAHPVLYSAKASSGWLDAWIRVGGNEDEGAGGAPSSEGSGPSSSVIPALIITASAFAIFYAAASGMGTKKRDSFASSGYDALTFSRGELHTPHGVVKMKRIGSGTFATVYRETAGSKRVFIFLPHGVPDKEIAELAHEALPNNPHIPAVERFGATEDRVIYTMPFYKTPFRKANAGDAWVDYKIISDCLDDMNDQYRYDRKVNAETVKCAKEDGANPNVVKALGALDKASRGYSNKYAFEFSPRNLGVDKRGNMVLLDVLFDRRLVPWEYPPA